MDPYAQAISRIIKEQQAIIGPMAVEQAKKVNGLQISSVDDVKITGNRKDVLNNLVNQYATLFGQASIEVCIEAFSSVSSKIPASDVPYALKS